MQGNKWTLYNKLRIALSWELYTSSTLTTTVYLFEQIWNFGENIMLLFLSQYTRNSENQWLTLFTDTLHIKHNLIET